MRRQSHPIFIYANDKTFKYGEEVHNEEKHNKTRGDKVCMLIPKLTMLDGEKKNKLRLMFSSAEWGTWKWTKSTKCKSATTTVLS